ncbi:MAG TPA: proline racemase family protein [Phenylobacterium sp.]|nr:proline racemase family protein [Phenylobacterium sp.]
MCESGEGAGAGRLMPRGALSSAVLKVVDMHTAGEPVRIVEAGYPELRGATILEKRRDAQARLDHLRRTLMLEPRGHAGMYGVIPTTPCRPDADLAVLFTHQEGYSTMCGHATIAIGRWAADTGRVRMIDGRAALALEAPCGLVRVEVTATEAGPPLVAFESVESFAHRLDAETDVAGLGRVRFDIAFGGAYYAILPASRIGLPLMTTPLDQLVGAGVAITEAVRTSMPIRHPQEPDLGFLYGTILTDDVSLGAAVAGPSYNLCVFAEGQIDRSPTGSGVTARLALAAARGEMAVGQSHEIRGVSGQAFVGALASVRASAGGPISRVRVAGQAFYSGRAEFVSEAADPFAEGFALPARFSDLAG